MDYLYFRTQMNNMLSKQFVSDFAQRYHYSCDDIPMIELIAKDIRICIKDCESTEAVVNDKYIDVAVTLGNNLDILIENSVKKGDVYRQMLIEDMSSELLMKGYDSTIENIRLKTEESFSNVCFWGDSEEYPIENMINVIDSFKHISLKVNSAGCLIPRKSMLFRIILSDKNTISDMNDNCKYGGHSCDNCNMGKQGKCIYKK